MELNTLIILVSVVFLFQIGLFILGRRIKKKEKENSVIEKYKIKTPKDAWILIGDQSIPEDDRKKIEELYQAREDK